MLPFKYPVETGPTYTMSSESAKRSVYKLVVRRLHHEQDIQGLLESLFGKWKLNGRGSAEINDKDTITFSFHQEHHLTEVWEGAPFTYKDWLVAMDLQENFLSPYYLSFVPIWVTIVGIPPSFHTERAIREIGSRLGYPTKTSFSGFETPGAGRCRVRILHRVTDLLKFSLSINFPRERRVTSDLRLSYDNQFNFCHFCGSILHATASCMFSILHQQNQILPSCPSKEILRENPSKRIKQMHSSDTVVCSQLNLFTVQPSQNKHSDAGFPDWLLHGLKGKTTELVSSAQLGSSSCSPIPLSGIPKCFPEWLLHDLKGKTAEVVSSAQIGFSSSSPIPCSGIPKFYYQRQNLARSILPATDPGFTLTLSPPVPSEPVIIHLDDDDDDTDTALLQRIDEDRDGGTRVRDRQ